MSKATYERKKETRREFLRQTAGVAAVAAAAGAAYYAGISMAPPPTTQIQTVTVTAPMTPAPTTPTPTPTKPRYGGILKFTIEGEPPLLDPHIAPLSIVAWTCSLVYEGLLDIDREGRIIPELAKTWEMPDSKTYIFHLRDDVYFHNGRKMIAEDVKYSFERIMDPKTGSPFQKYTVLWDRVEAPDDTTIKIILKEPFSPLLAYLAKFVGGIGFLVVPKEEVEKYGDLKEHMIGTGPFKFVEFRRGDYIKFERFDKYWRKDPETGDRLPYLDGLKETFQADWEVNLVNLKTEETMWLNVLNPKDWEEVSRDPDLTVLRPKSMMYFGLNINNRRKPWNDVRVRRAAAMAINREEVNKVVFYGLGGDAGNPFAHLPPPYNKIKVELPPYDPEAAKQLLADAGYKDGFDEVLVGCPAPEERKAAEVVAAQLSKVGIRCKVDLPEIGRLLDLFFVRKDFSICLCGGDGQIDPDGYFHAVYDPLPDCVSGYDNPKVTAMMEQQRREIDPEKRVQLWTEIFDQVLVKDVYTIWLNFRPMFFLYRRYVKGFDWGLDRRMKFHSIWLEK